MKSQQFDLAGCHVGRGNDFNTGRQTAPVCRRGDYPAPAKSEILHTPPQEKTGGGSEDDLNTIWRHISYFAILQRRLKIARYWLNDVVHEAMKGRTHVTSLIPGDLIRTYQEGEHEGTVSIARQVSEMVRLAEKAGIKPAQE